MVFDRYRRLLRLVFPAALTAFVASAPVTASGEFEKAARMAMSGDYESALKEYQKFVEDHPRDRLAPLAATAAGNLYLDGLGDARAAVRSYDVVISDYRTSACAPEAAARKGEALQSLEDWGAAAGAYRLALDIAAEQGAAQSALWINRVTASAAECYYRLEDHQGVLEMYEKALSGSPPPEVIATALYRMGEAYETMGLPEQASESYVRAIEQAPCASREILPQVLAKRALIDEHVSFDWEPYDAYLRTVDFINRRDFQGALDLCRETQARTSNAALLECLEARAISLEATVTGEFGEACRQMNEFREAHPGGQQDSRTRDLVSFWSSIVDAETEVAGAEENANALLGLGVLYYYAGAYPKAIGPTERAQQLDPEMPSTYEILGSVYFFTGRTEEAVRQFDALLEKGDPEDARVLNTAGTACLMTEQYDKAVRYFARYAEQSPQEAAAHSNLADALYRAGRPAESAEECQKALEIDPNSYSAYYFLGQVHKDRDEKDEALKAFERFLELAPEGPLADEVRGTVAEMQRG